MKREDIGMNTEFRAQRPEGNRNKNNNSVGGNGLKTGIEKLDELIDISSGIITLRSNNSRWLFSLAAAVLVRNHEPARKTLFLHWVDYHKRYWTMDYDFISGAAKSMGHDAESVSKSIFFIRAFSADSTEADENWKRIFRFGRELNFAVLDSVSELFESRPKYAKKTKNQTYAIGMFSRLCLRNNCVGLVLDRSTKPVHPFLGGISSVIISLCVERGVTATVSKHPYLEDKTVQVVAWGQQSLGRWLS